MSGKIATNTNRQSGVIGSVPSATTDASSPTITTNPTTGLGTEWINTTTGEIFICTNATTNENEWVGQTGNTIQPAPWGDRGLFFAGPNTDSIGYINITATGNTTDFGNLTVEGQAGNGWSNNSRGLIPSPGNESSTIEYVTISSTGDAQDFGDLGAGRGMCPGAGNRTRMVLTGGSTYEYVTMDTTGNAATFGTYTINAGLAAVCSNGGGDRMLKAAGRVSGVNTNIIEYITVSTTGNGTDFGDITVARDGLGGFSSEARGVFGSGYIMAGANTNEIDYVTIATLGNATDFGNMTTNIREYGATSNGTRGVTGGGRQQGAPDVNEIQYITIMAPSNSADFGDIYAVKNGVGGLSGAVS